MAKKKDGNKKIIAGGSATSGGINFQAAVTALVEVHVAAGQRLDWLASVANDIPVSVSAETGGAGDDIRIYYVDGTHSEVQVKRGLSAGKKFWEAIIKLSKAINEDEINFGVLVVCPNSSQTIRTDFARDLERISGGRMDGLKTIAVQFIEKIKVQGLTLTKVAKSLRIITLSCLVNDSDSIRAAKAWLGQICETSASVDNAWNALYLDGGKLIEFRGARTADSVARVLRSHNIVLKNDLQMPSTLFNSMCIWTVWQAPSILDT